MAVGPLRKKISNPYARALYNVAVKQCILNETTEDVYKLYHFLLAEPLVWLYLQNPFDTKEEKKLVLKQILNNQVGEYTWKFLMVLIDRDRIFLVQEIIYCYLELVLMSEWAPVKRIGVSTATELTETQLLKLTKKLEKLTRTKNIFLVPKVDPTLIAGFVLETHKKKIDFSMNYRLKHLANHLGYSLEL